MGGCLNLQAAKYIYIWRHLVGMIPPISQIVFDSIFSMCEIAQKSRVFCRDSVGGRAKNERIFEKYRVYMVGIFFNEKSMKLQWENGTKSHQITMGKWLRDPPFPHCNFMDFSLKKIPDHVDSKFFKNSFEF